MKIQKARSNGIVERISGSTLAYVRTVPEGRTFVITPEAFQNNYDKSFKERRLREGDTLSFYQDLKNNRIIEVKRDRVSRLSRKGGTRAKGEIRARIGFVGAKDRNQITAATNQLELHPRTDAKASIKMLRALPLSTRKFGKIIDISELKAGDLLLSRDLHVNSRISKVITDVQIKGGYDQIDARWTHAAMYLGDSANVVEATLDDVLRGGDVRITSLDQYCDGTSILRFRRSKHLPSESDGWRVCVRAMSRLKKPYSFASALRMWWRVAIGGDGFYNNESRIASSGAVVCSTLYADSYNEATNRVLGEVNGACVPAWLSLSDEFEEIETTWLKIM